MLKYNRIQEWLSKQKPTKLIEATEMNFSSQETRRSRVRRLPDIKIREIMKVKYT